MQRFVCNGSGGKATVGGGERTAHPTGREAPGEGGKFVLDFGFRGLG